MKLEPEPFPVTDSTVRFVDRADVKSSLYSIEESLKALNGELAHPALNGSTVYGLKLGKTPDDLLSYAGTIAIANVEDIDQHRLHFADNIVRRRKTLLAATRFVEAVDEKRPIYDFSKMNEEEDFTYSYPLFDDTSQEPFAVIQHAYHYPGNSLPEETELLAHIGKNHSIIQQITRSLQWLYQNDADPLTALELAPAINSNRYAIRWDITNKNLLSQIDYGTYMRYLQQSKQLTKDIVTAHCPTALLSYIDRQNIVIEFPRYIKRDVNNVVEIKLFQNREIAKLSTTLQEAHNALAGSYSNAFIPNLSPRVAVHFGNGFFEEDNDGVLQSELLTVLERQNMNT